MYLILHGVHSTLEDLDCVKVHKQHAAQQARAKPSTGMCRLPIWLGLWHKLEPATYQLPS
jgi:hypothetical protein